MAPASNDPDDQDLGESETSETFVFPPAERKVVTQPLDLSVQTLVDQWNTKLLILPEIQREYVWDNAKASRLIESLLLNIPIPVLYFAERDDARYEIFDGHQRIRSIVDFSSGIFPLSGLAVLREYQGTRYAQLPDREQRFFKMRTLRTVLIMNESHPNMKFEIYERLNTGSISLNAQELRNSIYRGTFNEALHELAKNTDFRHLIGTKTPRRRMVDQELILRFFAMRSGLSEYRPPLKKFLNNYMSSVRDVGQEAVTSLSAVFEETLRNTRRLLDTSAFRMLAPNGTPQETTVNRAIVECQLIAFSWLTNAANLAPQNVRSQIAGLFENPEFVNSVQRATGDRSRTLQRLRDTVSALTRAGGEVTAPFDLEA